MNIAYSRTSKHDRSETLARLKKAVEAEGLNVMGVSSLNDDKASVVSICNAEWAETVINTDPNLLGLLPCTLSIIDKGSEVVVSASTPALLGSAAPTKEILELVEKADSSLRAIVESAADVEPLKAKTIKLYSSHSCPYCTMEKKWLEQKKVEFELVYVDDDQKAAEDLVKRTGQMGVPVTEVIYENDESEFIIGFDKAKLEKVVSSM